MDLQHKIDRANLLYDEINNLEGSYDYYEDIPVCDLLKIIRMHDMAFDMVVDLINNGAWNEN